MKNKFLGFFITVLFIAMLVTSQPLAVFIGVSAETDDAAMTEAADIVSVNAEEDIADSFADNSDIDEDETAESFSSDSSSEEEEEYYNYAVPSFISNINEKENVSINIGSLQYNETLVTLAGINGESFNLGIEYDSSLSFLTQYDYRWQILPINDVLLPLPVADMKDTTYNEARYNIGAGWRFNIPSMNTDPHNRNLFIPGKGTFTYKDNSLINYPRSDMKLANSTAYSTEQFTSSKKLTFADGTVYYFNTDGLLLAMVDRFDNEVTFEYVQTENGWVPSEITDVYGRTVTVSYSNTETGKAITITAPDETVTVLNTTLLDSETYGAGNYILSEIVLPGEEEISFEYDIEDSFCEYNGILDHGTTIQLATLTNVSFPTGAGVNYEYEKREVSIGNGVLDIYRIIQRSSYEDIIDGDPIENMYYTYTGDYSREEIYNTKVTEVKDEESVTTDYKFSTKHLCTQTQTFVDEELKKTVKTTYDSYELPKKVVTTVYGTDEIETIELYTYDNYGRILQYVSAKAGGDNSLSKYKTYYTYAKSHTLSTIGYNLPKTVKYMINSNTTVEIKYDYTSDNKAISRETVYINSTPVSKTEYTYDGCGRVLTEKVYTDLTLGLFTEKEYAYSGGNLASVTVNNVADNDGGTENLTTSYTYDAMGRVITVTDANANASESEEKPKTVYTYDSRGRTVKITYPDGSYTDYIYNVANNVTTADHSLLEAAVYDYDGLGRLETMRLADGTVVSERLYDENSRLVLETTNNTSDASSATCYTYDVFDRIVEKTVYDSDDTEVYRETCEYDDAYTDSLSLVTKTVHGDENSADIVTKTYINKHGETVKEDIGGVITEYAYDYVSNPIRVFYGNTTVAAYTYDHYGNVLTETNTLGDTRSITYDAAGRKISESDYKGNITSYTYDAAGRLLTVTAPFADSVNTTVKYYYDANGNVTKQQQTAHADNSTEVVWRTVEYTYDSMNRVTDAVNHVSDTSEQHTHYVYDSAGNITHVYTGMTCEWTALLNPDTYRIITYTYDSRGNNTAITDAANESESYTYDVLGMLTSAALRDGTDIGYTYSPLGMIGDSISVGDEIVSSSVTEYTATGAVRSVTLDGATVCYTYDGLGNVLTETEGEFVKSYTYDSRGRRSGYTLSMDGEAISTAVYTYDTLDRLVSVTEGGKTTTYTYDENGNRESQSTDGVTAVYTYNNANLVTGMTNSIGELTISQFAYTYYLDGNIRTKTEIVGITTSNTAYVYDGVGRLVSETRDGITVTYEYDVYNNRTRMTSGGVVTAYTYDSNNRLLTETVGSTVTTYSYDANGNLCTASTSYGDTHAFVGGVCTACGDPATYMLGDLNGDGKINTIDVIRIQKLAQAQTVTYSLRGEQGFDSPDINMDGEVDVTDYLLFLEFVVGYSPVMPRNRSVPYDSFADINENGAIDNEDYAIALAAYNEPSDKIAQLAADVNGDGAITQADATMTLQHTLNNCACSVGSIVNNTSPCISAVSYTYNARGQQIGYTNINTAAEYGYNTSGLRNVKTVGGSTRYFVYNGSQIVYEYDELGGTIYYYGLNRTHNSSGEIYVYNAHGDTVQLVKDGAVTVTYTYDAFGNLISQIGESDNPFKYCGEYFDEETETYYLRARYYNPSNGRFTAEDLHWNAYNRIYGDNPFKIYEYEDALGLSKYTLLPSISAILQSNNLYVYCSNNPIMFVDPSGEAYPESAGGGGGGGLAIPSGYAVPPQAIGAAATAATTAATTAAVGATIDAVAAALNVSFASIKDKAAEKEAAEEVVAEPPKVQLQTYYHVTTRENAEQIILDGYLKGSLEEFFFVFAWRHKPNEYAIKNSGAHHIDNVVIISFQTYSSFVDDITISDSEVKKFGPVHSFRPTPAKIYNAQILG